MNPNEYHKNEIDITNKINSSSENSYWDEGAFINPDTGILTIYNEGGHNNTTCDIRKLLTIIQNNPKLSNLLSENKCSNCRYWTNEVDPCEWWTGKFIDDWKDAKFCSKSDFDYNNDENTNNITASAVSREGYIAGLMTKPNHHCNMFKSIERPTTNPPSSK